MSACTPTSLCGRSPVRPRQYRFQTCEGSAGSQREAPEKPVDTTRLQRLDDSVSVTALTSLTPHRTPHPPCQRAALMAGPHFFLPLHTNKAAVPQKQTNARTRGAESRIPIGRAAANAAARGISSGACLLLCVRRRDRRLLSLELTAGPVSR